MKHRAKGAIMMEKSFKEWKDLCYRGVLFTLNKGVLEEPIPLGMIDLYQIGELGLKNGGEVFEHHQGCHEISYIVSGEGYFGSNGVKRRVKAGDFHVVPKGAVHSIESAQHSRLRYEYMGFMFRDNLDEKKYQSLISFYENPQISVMQDQKNIHSALDMMLNELYAEREYSEKIFDSCSTQLLINVYRLYQKMEQKYYTPEISKEVVGEIAYDVMRYIDSHILEVGNVSWIADQLGYSSDYLTKLFKSKVGMSIQQYMQKKKIEYSMAMLQNRKYSVKEIASALHYESPQAFSKLFKKYNGVTPSEYLNQHQDEKL